MIYIARTAQILNDGTVVEGKRNQLINWPKPLEVGGLYFLHPGKLYGVVKEIKPGV